MTENIVIEREDGVLTLRLDRPEKKNALTSSMYTALADALVAADTDPTVRVVLITGSTECFTAGNDIADFQARTPDDEDNAVLDFMHALFGFAKPVVAAVAGVAVGIGTTMLLHCDLVYVARQATLRMPFVNLGLTPEFGSSVLVPALVGPVRAARLLLLGESFTGAQAAEWGIAAEALDDGAAALAAARDAARALCALAPTALQESKRLVRAPGREELRRIIDHESAIFSERLQSPEAAEAFSAFNERRTADFSRFV